MRFKDVIYLAIFLLVINGGVILVDAVAQSGSAHSFVRGITE